MWSAWDSTQGSRMEGADESTELQQRQPYLLIYENYPTYIKDNNQWLKETDEKPLLINAIKHVSNKNMKQILVKIFQNKNKQSINNKNLRI